MVSSSNSFVHWHNLKALAKLMIANKPGEPYYESQGQTEYIALVHGHGNKLSDRPATMQCANHWQ